MRLQAGSINPEWIGALSKQDSAPLALGGECLIFMGGVIWFLWGGVVLLSHVVCGLGAIFILGSSNGYMGQFDKKESASLDSAGLCWFFFLLDLVSFSI